MKTLLLTPGPLTTTERTRAALDRDWGSRDRDFVAMSEHVRRRLVELACVAESHVAVPLQGSGTFAVEAAIQTLVPRDGKLLVLVNGAYGRRMAEMAQRLGRANTVIAWDEDRLVEPDAVDRALAADATITDVAIVHSETTSGLLNPLEGVAAIVARHGRGLLVDAMSSFGGIPLGAGIAFKALMASANKCLEGLPGLAFVLAERKALAAAGGNASSVSLDLHAQWRGFEANGQWRFTPPTQIVAALDAALDQLDEEGGVPARGRRYAANCATLVAGMRALGFETYLSPEMQAPIIVTFREPGGGWFSFEAFYEFLHARGVVIYPGKLTAAPSFRIGCIGAIEPADLRRAIDAVAAFAAAHAPARMEESVP